MRRAFFQALTKLADQDPRIVLLTADLGYLALECFAERHPARFFNVGVSEQNMVGVATGLAEAGYLPFTYSIVPFSVLRPYEFIRNGPVHHRLPVRVVGVGGGVEYGTNGISHYGIEDVAAMRALDGIAVVAPADHLQAATALEKMWDWPGPVYIRLGKDDKTTVPGLDGKFAPGRLQQIGHGRDLLLVTMGSVAPEAVRAADLLAEEGIACTVAIVASVVPPPEAELGALLRETRLVMTVEEHVPSGGLGSLVAELIAENGIPCRLIRRNIGSVSDGLSGSQGYLRDRHGLSAVKLRDGAREAIQQLPPSPPIP